MTLVFLLVLIGFLALEIGYSGVGMELEEKRERAELPAFQLDDPVDFSRQFTAYYDDYFPFRGNFIFWNNYYKVTAFAVSPTPRVVIGKNHWFFLHTMQNRPGTTDYYRGITPFSPQDLEYWKNLLEARYHWLKARGIQYLFVVVPNKNTIYPEYMPDRIRKGVNPSRMDQLLTYLKQHSQVPFIDLRPVLLAGKKNYPVYSRTDTHWNDYGAYLAHVEIINHLSRYFPGVEPLPLSRFSINYKNSAGGDLAAMLSLHEERFREDTVTMDAHPPWTFSGGSLKRLSPFIRQGYTECVGAPLPNIVMVHDSFYKKIKPFLSERFGRIVYIWDWDMNFFPEIIERENPKLLIDEMAERFFLDKLPVNPAHMTP